MFVMRKDAKNHNTFARITYVHIIKNPKLFANSNVSRVLVEERQLGCGHLGTDAVVQSQRCAAMDRHCHPVSS